MKKFYSFLALFITFLIPLFASAQGTAQLNGSVLTINPKQMGYNVNSVRSGPDFRENEYKTTLNRLRPGNLRYPAGTIANYWDWRTGTIIQSITTGPRPYMATDVPYTIADFSKALPKGTEVVYVVNMVRPTPWTGIAWNASPTILKSEETLAKQIEDMFLAIDEFTNNGVVVTQLELGNEFYTGALGNANGAGGVYSADVDLYIAHANIIANAVHAKYPNMKIAILGDSVDEADFVKYPSGISPWTDSIYNAISNGNLNHIYAITFHWYTGPGVSLLDSDEKAMQSLSLPFGKSRAIKSTDFDKNRLGLDLWITEYANFSQAGTSNNPNNPGNGGAIQGTWINGMFMASQTLLYTMMGSEVSLLNVHGLLNNHIQWAMVEDKNTITGNGLAMSLTGRAMNGRNKAQEVKFNNIANPTFGPNNDPSLYGVKFWNTTSGALIVMNSTNEARTGVDISAVFSGTANKRLTCYSDPAPRLLDIADAETNRVNENKGLIYTYNDNAGNTVDFPPFSITVIEQDVQNLIKNGSFEDVTNEWSNLTFVQNDKRDAYSGDKSMLLNTTSQGFKGTSQRVAVSPNKEYNLQMMIRTDLTSGNGRFTLKYLDASNATIGAVVLSENTGGFQTYKSISKTFTTPAGTVNVDVTLQLANGLGSVWFDDVVLYESETVLPVTLTKFTAIKKAEGVLIQWTTAAELNNERFDLERSTDGKNFIKIAVLKGNGTTSSLHNYSFTDKNPNHGVNYYRLVQVDLDEKMTTSEIKALNFSLADDNTDFPFVIYPNPAKDKIFVNLQDQDTAQVKISIYNLQGQLIKQSRFSNNDLIQQDIQELKTGVYILRINEAITNKLIGESKFVKN